MPFFIGNNALRKEYEFMKKTTDFLLNIIMILGITLVFAAMPTEKDVAIYEDTLRLHILANSDSEDDQRLKYEIRDKLLVKYGDLLKCETSSQNAKVRAAKLKNDIEKDIEEWILESGGDYGCEIDIGTEWYDTREYEDFTLPKGYYTSLRIMLGDADGQNWWCVMYPPLCLDIATEDIRDDASLGYSKEEYALITKDGYNVKFKLLEVFSEAFSKKG
jgi:stage II sporulation protein R